jgi:membrane associated rhomboid family serine protease
MCDEMLEDRYYMRSEEPSWRFSATVILIIGLTVIFALQQIDLVYTRLGLNEYLALSTDGLRKGFLWQLFTFQFLHVELFWHLVGNLIGLWFFGRAVESRLGTANFLKIYFGSALLGGILHSLLAFAFPRYFGMIPVMGASAGVFGIVAAFALIEPEAPIMFMLILPLKAKHLLIIEASIAVFFTVVPSDPRYAHAAHLGGVIAGVAFMRWRLYDFAPSFNWHPLRNRARRRQLVKAATVKPAFWKSKGSAIPKAEQVEPEEFISREVDPILDKISAQGLQSLTPREKQILEAARSKMDKR